MGTLYIVATPIGNLGDITLRALETLKIVDYILCEDTRVCGKLLNHFQLDKKMASFNDFNEASMVARVVSDLLGGKKIALISDAGTPLVSDPGYKLVREAILQGVEIESIPGPSAAIVALTVSGKPPDKFLFLGYLNKKPSKRKSALEALRGSIEELDKNHLKPTVIFYESPYRLVDMLGDIHDVFGDVDIVIARELTKMHQEVRREKVSDSITYFAKITPRGEFVLLI